MAMIPDSLKESIQSKFSFGGGKKDTSPAPDRSIKEFQIAAKIIAKNLSVEQFHDFLVSQQKK